MCDDDSMVEDHYGDFVNVTNLDDVLYEKPDEERALEVAPIAESILRVDHDAISARWTELTAARLAQRDENDRRARREQYERLKLEFEPGPAQRAIFIEGLIGTVEAAAVQKLLDAGLTPRICRRDEQWMVVTRDLRTDRVNLQLEGGVVVKAHIG